MKNQLVYLLSTLMFFALTGKGASFTFPDHSTTNADLFEDFNPEFEILNGNIFMVAQLPEFEGKLANGNKIEFVFGVNNRESVLHIETDNSKIITQEEYDLLALVPEEVARALNSNTLKKIIVHLPEGKKVIKVNRDQVHITAVTML